MPNENLLESVYRKALSDGMINRDEAQMLKKLSENYCEYKNALEKALEDNVITEEEQQRLNEIKNNLFKLLQAQAEADGSITPDESALLEVAKNFSES